MDFILSPIPFLLFCGLGLLVLYLLNLGLARMLQWSKPDYILIHCTYILILFDMIVLVVVGSLQGIDAVGTAFGIVIVLNIVVMGILIWRQMRKRSR